LVGLMGCGKSTVGGVLAPHLTREYVDNDARIAAMAGRSTVELAASGGALLHDWESKYVHEVAVDQHRVVAGIPASAADRHEDMELLRQSGTVIYLRCDVDTLVLRVQAGGPRPWLTDDARPVIESMLATRDPIYLRAAHVVIDGSLDVSVVVERIAARLRG
jgi:shikimate kinase